MVNHIPTVLKWQIPMDYMYLLEKSCDYLPCYVRRSRKVQ